MQNSTLAIAEFLMHTVSKTAQEGLDMGTFIFWFFTEDSRILSQTQISSD